MKFTLRIKDDDSEIVFVSTMNIDNKFPAAEPDKYKEYISEHPVQKLCDFINEQIGTRV